MAALVAHWTRDGAHRANEVRAAAHFLERAINSEEFGGTLRGAIYGGIADQLALAITGRDSVAAEELRRRFAQRLVPRTDDAGPPRPEADDGPAQDT